MIQNIVSDKNLSPTKSSGDNNASKLSKQSLDETLSILMNEQQKLDDFEMVVAVVGTMKAGKSTVINAIVGNEVVPNRNRPMTALPTLITHSQGLRDPELEFNNNSPVNELLRKISSELNNSKLKHVFEEHRKDRDMNELLLMIETGKEFGQRYSDRESIYAFLRSLNDLVRLAKDLNLEFPFNEYRNTKNLPRIKVEFAHIKETENTQGKLTLLDTPGPNEAGQDNLKRMLGEQLKRASAVLAVLDYTQLKSDADADVRRQLDEIASLNEGRMFALVNRYDQKDKNSDDIETTKRVVAEQLMKGKVDKDDIFPVSARYAYLSNRARNQLDNEGKLPELNNDAPEWLHDYVEFIVGNPRYYRPEDQKILKEDIEDGWTKSLFSEPLEIIIKSAHEKSALMVVSSVAAKLRDNIQALDNSIQARKGSLAKTIDEIEENIKEIQKDIEAVKQQSEKALEDLNKAFKATDAEVKKGFKYLVEQAEKDLKHYFAEGKRQEQAEKEIKQKSKEVDKKRESIGFLTGFLEALKNEKLQNQSKDSKKNNTIDFDPKSPVIEFSSRRDADKLLDKVHKSVDTSIKSMEENLKKGIEFALQGFNDELEVTSQQAQKQIKGLEERLAKQDINLSIKLPDADKLNVDFVVFDVLDDMVKHDTVTKYDERRQDNAWGTVCSWFGTSDWGWETYSYQEDVFKVDIKKIQKSVMNHFKETFGKVESDISSSVKEPLEKSLNEFFKNFENVVEAIRADFTASKKDKEKDQGEQKNISESLSKVSEKLKANKKDVEDLYKDASRV
ncbi:MAG: dynamin family protein [Methyloprofundus sp.]|nr:dynamin family protein [Methyloprofundus sp.]